MKKYPNLTFRQIILPAILLLICLHQLYLNCSNSLGSTYYNVPFYNARQAQKLDSTTTYEVYSSKKILLKNLGSFDAFIAPSNKDIFNDNLHLIFILAGILFYVFMLSRNLKAGAFYAKLSVFTAIFGIIAIYFSAMIVFRDLYFIKKVERLTNSKYSLELFDHSLNTIEFWIFMVLSPFAYFLRKAEKLLEQKDIIANEQELTI